MTKCICLFFLIVVCVKLTAQDSTAREQKLKDVLKMSGKDFAVFTKDIKRYNRRLDTIFKDTRMSFGNKTLAVNKLQVERKTYMQQHLSATQLTLLDSLERNSPEAKASPHSKQMKDLEERLRKRREKNEKRADSLKGSTGKSG